MVRAISAGGKFKAGVVQPFIDSGRQEFVGTEIPEKYLHQQRGVPGELKKDAGAPAEKLQMTHPHDGDNQPEQKGEDDPCQ